MQLQKNLGGAERGLHAIFCLRILNSLAAPLHLLAECWHVELKGDTSLWSLCMVALVCLQATGSSGDENVITRPLPINIDLVVRL